MSKRRRREPGTIYDPNALLNKTRLLREEAAFLLEVSPRTIDHYLQNGKIDFKLTPGGRRRVLTESLKRFL